MQAFLDREILGNPVEAYLFFLGTFIVFYIGGKVLSLMVRHLVSRLVWATKNQYDDVIVEALRGPLMAAMVLMGLRMGALCLRDSTSLSRIVVRGVGVAVVMVVGWFSARLWHACVDRFLVPLSKREGARLEPMLIPVLRRIVVGGIWIFTIIIAASDLGYNIVSLLTGLGIGGLAVALAAKDTLSPMVGGVAIFMTKPFAVGHYIRVDQTEGTVEEIGLRATTLRTKGGSIIIVPNDRIINSTIVNRFRDGASKVSLKIGVPYDLSADELDRLCAELKLLVAGLPGVDPSRGGCKLDSFADSAILLRMNYWVTDAKRYGEAQHAATLAIKRKFDDLGVEFPYPTQAHVVAQAGKPRPRRLDAPRRVEPKAEAPARVEPAKAELAETRAIGPSRSAEAPKAPDPLRPAEGPKPTTADLARAFEAPKAPPVAAPEAKPAEAVAKAVEASKPGAAPEAKPGRASAPPPVPGSSGSGSGKP